MAKVERGARSQAIRDYLQTNHDANVKQIVDALKGKGITVSESLASAVKYNKGAGKKGRRGRRSGTRSEAIRGHLTEHPAAPPSEVQAALAQQGMKVKLGLISNVKHTLLKQAPKMRLAPRSSSANAEVSVDDLVQ